MNTENLFTPNCIRTFTGKYVNVFEPTPEMFDIEDIAHALANQCRFSGHIKIFYSVAEHCLNGVRLFEKMEGISNEILFQFLMHDASEAYLMDIPKPIKPSLSNYMAIEDTLMRNLSSIFNFKYPFDSIVHDMDLHLLKTEWNELMIGTSTHTLSTGASQKDAKEAFIKAYHRLKP